MVSGFGLPYPKNAAYKSLVEKLFWYNLTPNDLRALATKSLEIP